MEPKLPAVVHVLDDVQEIEPGILFPMQWMDLACHAMDGTGLMENRMIV